jgi:hypothetical protein
VSGRHAEKAVAVIDVIDQLVEEGKSEEAEELRRKLNKNSVSAAYRKAVTSGLLPNTQPTAPKPAPVGEHLTICLPIDPSVAVKICPHCGKDLTAWLKEQQG